MWAQPRGKSNKSRLQGLSGGEKSMASLSLIFAIQDHDPSPFYYFDEVDQNLDVPNSKLIATECRNRSEAQFIMVTLRKVSWNSLTTILESHTVETDALEESSTLTENVQSNWVLRPKRRLVMHLTRIIHASKKPGLSLKKCQRCLTHCLLQRVLVDC